jgi:hypothetical protein
LVCVHPAGFGIGGSAVATGSGGMGKTATEAVALGTIGVLDVDVALAETMGSMAAFGTALGAEIGWSTTLGASGAGSLHPA